MMKAQYGFERYAWAWTAEQQVQGALFALNMLVWLYIAALLF